MTMNYGSCCLEFKNTECNNFVQASYLLTRNSKSEGMPFIKRELTCTKKITSASNKARICCSEKA